MNDYTGEVKTLHFSITGEFVTETARRWFWDELQPYDKVEDFLLSCMAGTDIPEETLKKWAQDVLIGRARLIGDTRDGSYAFQDDDSENSDIVFQKMEEYQTQLRSLRKKLEEAEFPRQETSYSDRLSISMVDDFLAAGKHDDNYGWLDPQGNFYPVDWGRHQGWAFDEIKKREWSEEYRQVTEQNPSIDRGNSGDFLIYTKGWVLLHNPAQGTANVTRNPERKLTKAQSEFLFQYYIDRGKDDLANEFWEEMEC